jgi:transcriptional regulator with XRE-family HTH domain
MRNREKPHTKSDSISDTLVQPASNQSRLAHAERRAFTVRLRQLVDESGSKSAFAGFAGVTQRSVRLWLERAEPTREKLAAIAKATGVSLDWLISGRGPKMYSECPPGYIALDFYDLVKSRGYLNALGGPDRTLLFDRALLALDADEHANLLALYLLPDDYAESIVTASDFVIVDRGARDLIPSSPSAIAEEERYRTGPLGFAVLCAVIEKGRAQTWIIGWATKPKPAIIFESIGPEKKQRRFESDEEMAAINILGPVRFRAGLIRPPLER